MYINKSPAKIELRFNFSRGFIECQVETIGKKLKID
jgi:hypothetical protein